MRGKEQGHAKRGVQIGRAQNGENIYRNSQLSKNHCKKISGTERDLGTEMHAEGTGGGNADASSKFLEIEN